MPDKAIRVYTQEWSADEYEEGVANGDLPPTDDTGQLYLIKDYADSPAVGDWNEDETVWVPASDVDTAVHLLTGGNHQFWAAECSDTSAVITPRAWYDDQPYTHPYTGAVTEQSAHLVGDWTDQEATLIRTKVLRR
jgi:hypothetical protein